MPSIRKRGERWQAQIRRSGCPAVSRSFRLKADAERWAAQVEAQADGRGLVSDLRPLRTLTLANLIERYRDSVSVTHRGHLNEVIILNAFLRHPVASTKLNDLRSQHLAAYRDERLKKVRPATINRELGLIQHALEIARREWSIPLPTNPAKDVSKPSPDRHRERRLEPGEEEALMEAINNTRNPVLGPLVSFAIETGMRRGEMLNAKWADVNFDDGTMKIPLTKNGEPRIIPLTLEALNILRELSTECNQIEPALLGTKRNKLNSANIFPITQDAFKKCWKRAVYRAGIQNIHFHDLRHEAISRFFEMGLSVPEVALISGHKDVRMLFRYTHIRAADLASKIISRTRSNSV